MSFSVSLSKLKESVFGEANLFGRLNERMELLDDTYLAESRWWRACIAGSIAGLTEHMLLYPIDTVKTRLQAVLHKETLTSAINDGTICPKQAMRLTRRMAAGQLHAHRKAFGRTFAGVIRREGALALFRGLPAVLMAAIPSHAAYFGSYEYAKWRIGARHGVHQPLQIAAAGVAATGCHDLIVTPFDVVKQRMQLRGCKYANVCRCAIETFKREGYTSFFRSYPSAVLLNIPMFCTNFTVYESTKLTLGKELGVGSDVWYVHFLSGAFAGGLAGFISNPLDLIKTTIQTDTTKGYKSISGTLAKLRLFADSHKSTLGRVLMSGSSARIIYFIPSTAVTWTTYEAMKRVLKFPIDDLEDIIVE